MNPLTSSHRRAIGVAAATLSALVLNAPVAAQDAKAVVPESVPAAPAFGQWVNTVVLVVAEPSPAPAITAMPLAPLAAAPQPSGYEPLPVIVGLPELPLVGAGAATTATQWAAGLNYQGMHVRLLVLDAAGRRIESRPLGAPLRPGERFKVRITSTFPAVSEIGHVVGDAWTLQRAGQLYPAPGISVQMNAGETVDLPLGPQDFFTLGAGVERIVLSVRHAGAVGPARSLQPAYRQDGRSGSSYLQLVPQGTLPALEQLLVATH